jgi:hypothetical protein
MPEYLVTWEIEVDADSPLSAAMEALQLFSERTPWFTVVNEDGEHFDVDTSTGDVVQEVTTYAPIEA